MTREERKMVGTLMEMGVPTYQIKNAVGQHVTLKDLQNAKTHIKAVKMGLKSDEPKTGPRRRKTFKELQEERREARHAAGEIVSDTDEEGREQDSNSSQNTSSLSKFEHSTDGAASRYGDNANYTVTIGDIEQLGVAGDPMGLTDSIKYEKDSNGADIGGLSGLLAAAGLSSDSVVLTVNNQGQVEGLDTGEDGVKNSYTVTVSLPEGDVTQTGTNLQELLKGLPLGKIISKSSSPCPSPAKIKTEDFSATDIKSCLKCGGYISPLDGHGECLNCLGPEHIHDLNCEHCKAMTVEQFNIRRKKMVALRMKALKELRRKRRQDYDQLDENADSDSDYSPTMRKSKRMRKPKNFGPDMAVESPFVMCSPKYPKHQSGAKLSLDEEKPFSDIVPKCEPPDEYGSSCSYDNLDPLDQKDFKFVQQNTQRFDHILSQTTVFDDVKLVNSDSESSCFTPEAATWAELQKLSTQTDLPAVPHTMNGKYALHPKFESTFCSDPQPLVGITDPGVETMASGLFKLAKNAAAQIRVSVYDKLFTRLGVGMADEALSILSELYSKVTEVTEISQEDLTSNLQTALDTIQALKDVLEELGIMSKDAISTASHQRTISVHSLAAAKKCLKLHQARGDEITPRRSKFLPFAKANLKDGSCELVPSAPPSNSTSTMLSSQSSSPTYSFKQLTVNNCTSQNDTSIASLPLSIASSQDNIDASSVTSTSFIMSTKEFSVAPLSNELLQSLSNNKDGIIELHVMKDGDELLDTEEATIEEVIQTE